MSPEKKSRVASELVAILAALCLLALITRLWPVLLLMLLGLFAYGLWKLFRVEKQPAVVTVPPTPAALTEPVTEQELITVAFGLLNRRITQQVTAVYPLAKWIYSEGGARERFARGEPLTILLNGAGGYQKALVQVSDLQMYGLTYLPQARPEEAPEPESDTPEDTDDAEPVDYGLLAFEWVEANLQRLNTLANEATARSDTGFRIPAEELPHGDSWMAVCTELVRNGFAAAVPLADGIHVKIKTEE